MSTKQSKPRVLCKALLHPSSEDCKLLVDAELVKLSIHGRSDIVIPFSKLINVMREHDRITFWYLTDHHHLFQSSPHVHQTTIRVNEPLSIPNDLFFSEFPSPFRGRILVILNPRAGAARAEQEGLRVFSSILRRANIDMDLYKTQYPRHASQMGKHVKPSKYEGVAFMSGDGTIQEFLRGVVTRGDWKKVLHHLKIVQIPCGTTNALAKGLGISSPLVAAACVLANRVVSLDSAYVQNGARNSRLSLCGVGWGVPSEIAEYSERYRCFGRLRYFLLKLRFGCFCPRRHEARARFTTKPWFKAESFPSEGIAFPFVSHPASTPKPAPTHSLKQHTTPEPNPYGVFSAQQRGIAEQGLRIICPPSAAFDAPDATPRILRSPADDYDDAVALKPPDSPAFTPFRHSSPANVEEASDFDDKVKHVMSFYEQLKDSWNEEAGDYVTISGLNLHPDAKFSRAGDTYFDGIFARRGGLFATLQLLGKYLVGRQYESQLFSYRKLRALQIIPNNKDSTINVDGEVFQGPGPFTLCILPRFVKAYGIPPEVEKFPTGQS